MAPYNVTGYMSGGYGTMQPPRPGLGNVNSYLISGYPYLTGGILNAAIGTENGEKTVVFPSVCRSFTVINNTAQPILIHFDSRANADIINKHHYVELSNLGDSWTFAVRATATYISMKNNPAMGEFSLAAELTSIEGKELKFPLTGSGINTD